MFRMVAALSLMAVTTPPSRAPIRVTSCGLDGDVGAGAYGYAYVGLGECRGVVDSVPDHGDGPALRLEFLYLIHLVLGHNLGEDGVYADLVGYGLGGVAVVAGYHHRANSHAPDFADGLGGILFQGVCYGYYPCGHTVYGCEHGGLSVLGEGLELRRQGRRGGCRGPASRPGYRRRRCAHHTKCPNPLARLHFEVRGLGEGETTVYGGGSNGTGHGVFGGALGGGGQGKDLIIGEIRDGIDVCEGRLAKGEGTGLVEDDGVDAVGGLQGLGGADEDSELGAFSQCLPLWMLG